MSQLQDTVLKVLSDICQSDEIYKNPDLPLFDTGLLDSMGLVELLVEIEAQLGIIVAITDFDREQWSTPNKIILFLEEKQI